MLWTLAFAFIMMWLLGLVTGYLLGYFIQILLVIAGIIVLVRIIRGRTPI